MPAASRVAARDRRGRLARRSLAEERSARASILVAYNKSNRSRTSSAAWVSKWAMVASSVAVRRVTVI
jgi:hypothetical protein